MQAVEIRKGIYWVGAIDWSMRSFHGYETSRGSSYNAYLILDAKNHPSSIPSRNPSRKNSWSASLPSSIQPRLTISFPAT